MPVLGWLLPLDQRLEEHMSAFGGSWAVHFSGKSFLFDGLYVIFISKQFSPANIHNYLAGAKAQFIVHNMDTSPF